MDCTILGTPSMERLFSSPSISGWGTGTRLPAFSLLLNLFFPTNTPPQIWLLGLQIKSLSLPLSFMLTWAHLLRMDLIGSLLSLTRPPQIHIRPICDRSYGIWLSAAPHQCPDCSINRFVRLHREKLNRAV